MRKSCVTFPTQLAVEPSSASFQQRDTWSACPAPPSDLSAIFIKERHAGAEQRPRQPSSICCQSNAFAVVSQRKSTLGLVHLSRTEHLGKQTLRSIYLNFHTVLLVPYDQVRQIPHYSTANFQALFNVLQPPKTSTCPWSSTTLGTWSLASFGRYSEKGSSSVYLLICESPQSRKVKRRHQLRRQAKASTKRKHVFSLHVCFL